MSRIARKLRKWTVDALDLPGDVVMEIPRLTVMDGRQLLVENHRGILHFSAERLSLALDNGGLEILGEGMVLKTILPQELIVEGRIDEIKYIRTEGNK